MKTIIGALALILAAPVAAQAAPAADPHAQHQDMDHSQHQQGQHEGHEKGCCEDANKDGKMDCCEKMKQQGKEMECCKKGDGKQADAPAAGHDGHANHDH